MSAKATFWAWSHRGLSASQKLVLLCLADNHNGDTKRCDPSIKYISDKTGLNRKTIMQALAELENLGLISQEKRFGTSTNFTLKTSTEIGTSTKNGLSQNRTSTSTEIGHNQYRNWDTNLKESKTESKTVREHNFSMVLDWEPNPDYWEGNCQRSGVNPDYSETIHEFRLYWSGESRKHTEQQWQGKLIQNIKRQYQKTHYVTKDPQGLVIDPGVYDI